MYRSQDFLKLLPPLGRNPRDLYRPVERRSALGHRRAAGHPFWGKLACRASFDAGLTGLGCRHQAGHSRGKLLLRGLHLGALGELLNGKISLRSTRPRY